MRVIITYILLLVSTCLWMGCAGFKVNKLYTADSGLQYRFTKVGKGAKPKTGDNVKVHYVGTLDDGTIFDSSRDRNNPIVFKLGVGRVIKGWDEGIALLPIGSQVTFIIPPELGYGARQKGKIPANSKLTFDVELLNIIPEPKPFEVSGKDTIHLESGLKYIKLNSTEGKQAEAFRTVNVHYTGFTTSSEIFDSSVERDTPFNFTLGKGMVIRGWDEGIAMLREGEKARLIVPSELAYGERGFPPKIKPGATLIFDVELIKVFD